MCTLFLSRGTLLDVCALISPTDAPALLAGPSVCCNHRLHLETEAAGSRFRQVSLKLAVEHLWLLSEGLWSI